ncbi:hypothetical protein AGLY_005580 [Aphis glycines]|uniref:Uncharacterized protein n=1 Tax=Aphis glycines TaxID=307491 RepID=A0A6G0TU44_APHGL|nr:hypothetical protein AGLY_005580 [Aphis glycines]
MSPIDKFKLKSHKFVPFLSRRYIKLTEVLRALLLFGCGIERLIQSLEPVSIVEKWHYVKRHLSWKFRDYLTNKKSITIIASFKNLIEIILNQRWFPNGNVNIFGALYRSKILENFTIQIVTKIRQNHEYLQIILSICFKIQALNNLISTQVLNTNLCMNATDKNTFIEKGYMINDLVGCLKNSFEIFYSKIKRIGLNTVNQRLQTFFSRAIKKLKALG